MIFFEKISEKALSFLIKSNKHEIMDLTKIDCNPHRRIVLSNCTCLSIRTSIETTELLIGLKGFEFVTKWSINSLNIIHRNPTFF